MGESSAQGALNVGRMRLFLFHRLTALCLDIREPGGHAQLGFLGGHARLGMFSSPAVFRRLNALRRRAVSAPPHVDIRQPSGPGQLGVFDFHARLGYFRRLRRHPVSAPPRVGI